MSNVVGLNLLQTVTKIHYHNNSNSNHKSNDHLHKVMWKVRRKLQTMLRVPLYQRIVCKDQEKDVKRSVHHSDDGPTVKKMTMPWICKVKCTLEERYGRWSGMMECLCHNWERYYDRTSQRRLIWHHSCMVGQMNSPRAVTFRIITIRPNENHKSHFR